MTPTAAGTLEAPKTFKENVPPFDPLNQCRECKIWAGKYEKKVTRESVGIYLRNDARGGKICNMCVDRGLGVFKTKMNKSDKRREKKMRREMQNMMNIPHITVDAKGRKVTS